MEQLSFDDLEAWKPVPTWDGYYEVSGDGYVRSLPRTVRARGDGMRLVPGRVLKPSYGNSGGYPLVILQLGDRREGRYVHDLVTLAFLGPRPEGTEVRHLDGNASSAALWGADGTRRLVYGTSGENKHDQVRHGTHPEASRDCCDAGHEFTEENTHIQLRPDGSFKQRVCRACRNERVKEWRKDNAANKPPCTKGDCEEPQLAKELCSKHYHQKRREDKRNAAEIRGDASDAA